MEILAPITEDKITESFLSIVRYCIKHFKLINVDVPGFWSKIFKHQDEKPQWRPALLIIKICLCAPTSNASLERLFNQMNLVKSAVCNHLKNSTLNALLRIKVSNVSVEFTAPPKTLQLTFSLASLVRFFTGGIKIPYFDH